MQSITDGEIDAPGSQQLVVWVLEWLVCGTKGKMQFLIHHAIMITIVQYRKTDISMYILMFTPLKNTKHTAAEFMGQGRSLWYLATLTPIC